MMGVLALIAGGAAVAFAWRIVARRRILRGEWVAECPNTETTVTLTLDGAAGRVTGCSHWPELKDCDQGCVGAPARSDVEPRRKVGETD